MNKQQFKDFQTRLISHHRGHVNNYCTADPIYLVQKQVIAWGYVEEYAEHHQLYGSCDESYTYSAKEFFEDWDEGCIENLLKDSMYSVEDFTEYSDMQGLEILEGLLNNHIDYKYNGYQLQHGNERYETVEIFLTHKAAEDFLKAKGWQLGDGGGRIYVDSLCRSSEFKGLINLIVDGTLVFKEERDEK